MLSLINTLTGTKIDIERQKFAIANKTGGMSGPAVKPIAVRMVYQVAQAVKVPIIGMGGIASAEDALEFILAGATAVSIGTANFFNPYATVETVRGIEEYMRRHKVDDINFADRGGEIRRTASSGFASAVRRARKRGRNCGSEWVQGNGNHPIFLHLFRTHSFCPLFLCPPHGRRKFQ